jgi:nucleotide-binding universal stress UspA family protein
LLYPQPVFKREISGGNKEKIHTLKLVMNFQKIGLAIAFSPTAQAMLAEAVKLTRQFNASLALVHVGAQSEENLLKIKQLITETGIEPSQVSVLFRKGNPVDEILKFCKEEKIDLLIAGALKKENLVGHYIGTIARKIMRKADCSLLMLTTPSTTPSTTPASFRNIVVNAEDSAFIQDAISTACQLGSFDHAQWIHIVRELKLLSLTLSASDQCTEEEYEDTKQMMVREEITKVEEMLSRIPHEGLKINIKVVAGKSGFELSKFAERKHADLLIVGAPPRKFSIFGRAFPRDLEYVFADMPCNLLIINLKEVTRG